MELAGVLRLRTGRGHHSGRNRAGGGSGGRRHRIVRGHRVEQDRTRFPRERPAAVRGQALPAIRRIGEYFLKAGPDSPETLLAYEDFDNTRTLKTAIHAYAPHVQDWKTGDPTWGKTKGKALIGAINYLASKGMNAMSLMPYNGGGDGDNVWPFVDRDDKFHYDVSKLDQWQIVFDHAQAKGIYLHFKLQEQENDDGTFGGGGGGGGRGWTRRRAAAGLRQEPWRRRAARTRRQRRRRLRPRRLPRRKAAAPEDEEPDRPPHVRCPRRSTVATPGASAGCISAS